MIHKRFGEGKVLTTRASGLELFIEFEDGITRWVRMEDVRFSETNKQKDKILSNSQTNSVQQVSHVINNRFKPRKIIESLRLGIFPQDYIDSLTFGREREVRKILEWLKDPEEGALISYGEYGSGKTHFLEYIYYLALKENWAVSFVELRPNETPLHKPKAIYEKIINSFKYHKNKNFETFLREIAENPNSNLINAHHHLGEIVRRIKGNTDFSFCWDWIKGRLNHSGSSIKLPPISRFSTWANIICYVLSGIGYAAKNVLGLKGFLILFDEAENIDVSWYNNYQDQKGWNFLRGLILMAENNDQLLNELIKEQFSYTTKSKGTWGEKTKLQYCKKHPYRYLWKKHCNIKSIFTFTPNLWIFNREPLLSLDKLELNNLKKEALQNVATKVADFYRAAYDFESNKKVYLNLKQFNTRTYIKAIIEILDLIRFHPNKEIDDLIA
ncbi:hypothetical protein LCGC14_0970310 [marine sediment metagenome]|uniref:ATP-binding protein n=1 Tax=marine sediment metagenome TaxID=412755 RepID=A0A0F9RI89_9ZZZZ